MVQRRYCGVCFTVDLRSVVHDSYTLFSERITPAKELASRLKSTAEVCCDERKKMVSFSMKPYERVKRNLKHHGEDTNNVLITRINQGCLWHWYKVGETLSLEMFLVNR